MTETGCYVCIHNPVCKYWDNWRIHFPYKDDSCIKVYLNGLSQTLSTACIFFEHSKDKE